MRSRAFPSSEARVVLSGLAFPELPRWCDGRLWVCNWGAPELFAAARSSDFDLPLNFHPTAIRASAGFTPWGAGGATCDRRSWSGLRRRSHVAERLAA